ncbi:MAG: STAS domain-containing protein [Acidobacteriota bacterium]|jgi:anti-sigma B factor antagonist
MKIETRERGEITVVKIAGRFTYGQGDVLVRTTFRDLLAAGHRRFVLEMRDVAYLDSSAVGELVACQDRAIENGGSIRLVPNARIRRLLDLYQLERIFPIFPDVEDALASFAVPILEPVH